MNEVEDFELSEVERRLIGAWDEFAESFRTAPPKRLPQPKAEGSRYLSTATSPLA
jgi:hypothetical protein